jgi:hypothetical protein
MRPELAIADGLRKAAGEIHVRSRMHKPANVLAMLPKS